jgi:hypothetical protein
MWFGAVNRLGTVGLHRPRFGDPAFKALAGADATRVYKGVLLEIARYLEEMEVPRPMIDAMVATGSSDIRWANYDKDGLERPPSFAEWEDSACGSTSKEEEKTYWNLTFKEDKSADEKLLLQLLNDKHSKRRRCLAELESREIDRLALP